MELPIKGSTWEVPQEWIAELDKVFYNVEIEMGKMRLWLISKPNDCPTKAGIKRFMVNWMKRDPKLIRPVTKSYEKPQFVSSVEPLETRKARLAELKGALVK